MIQVQLRYFQYILSLAIFAGIVISSTPLISACFVGLTLIWLTETLVAQFDINTEKFYVVLVLLLIAFSTVSIKSLSPDTSLSYLFSGLLIVTLLYFLLQPDINLFKVGNSLFATVIAMLVNSFIVDRAFQENIIYVKTSPTIANQRVLERARDGEIIPIEYLENCHKYHEDWLKHTNKEKVITLDGNINTKLNPNVIDNWVSDIFEFLKI